MEKFFMMSNLNFPWHSLSLFPFLLPLVPWEEPRFHLA